MAPFDYAQPATVADVLSHLSAVPGETEILAGGTDLVGLMRKMVVTPQRVVNIMDVSQLQLVEEADDGSVVIGAACTLDRLLDSPLLAAYPAVQQAISSLGSIQLQCQGTIGGDLCQRPRCWYFRSAGGLLAEAGKLVEQGAHEQHAIFGNDGPAKFVSSSRLAPALIAHGAQVRIAGPAAQEELVIDLADLFRTPRHEGERETVLQPKQLLTHIVLPKNEGWTSGIYEVRQSAGPDFPLCAAAAAVKMSAGRVSDARVVLGQVAPTPWVSEVAAHAMESQTITEETAAAAGELAAAQATPLPDNQHKVALAKTCVKRALLAAAGLPTGGL